MKHLYTPPQKSTPHTIDESYLKHLTEVAHSTSYTESESSLSLPSDSTHLRASQALYGSLVTKSLKYVVVVGIGGSNLGTQAIYEALRTSSTPTLLMLDTTSTHQMESIVRTLTESEVGLDEMIICMISKSGGTTETIANTEILIHHLHATHPQIYSRLVVITDEGSALAKQALHTSAHVLYLPHMVGGRYSVLSCVGLFPLMCLGIDVEMLLGGARETLKHIDHSHHAHVMSSHIYSSMQDGSHIYDIFLFDTRLEYVGRWCRQLIAESIGKSGKGILPTVSIGSTDLHSVAQLYLGGPNDRYTTFVWIDQPDTQVVPHTMRFPLVPNLEGRSLGHIHRAIYEGTLGAYAQVGRVYDMVSYDSIDAYRVGHLMQSMMLMTMFLGRFMQIDAFDQPQVELYKKVTRELLAR